MKKIAMTLGALALILVMTTACSSPVKRLESLTKDIQKNGDEWTDEDKWLDVTDELTDIVVDFAESDFTEDELKDFVDEFLKMTDALLDLDKDALKAARKAGEKMQKDKKKYKDLQKKLEAATKKAKKHLKDLDIDEEEFGKELMPKILKLMKKVKTMTGGDASIMYDDDDDYDF